IHINRFIIMFQIMIQKFGKKIVNFTCSYVTFRNCNMCKIVEKYAIEYFHCLDIAHRDFKLQNILLNYQNEVKAADFGLKSFSNKRTLLLTRCGTWMFMPPEVLMSSKTDITLNSSIFGGVLHYIIIMLIGQVPFDDGRAKQIVAQQVSGDIVLLRPMYKRTVSSSAKRLVPHMLEPDMQARIAVVKHSKWMTTIGACKGGASWGICPP
ncbi:hypothetical protein AGLY_009138, partial [Aphis glycines]